VRKEVSCDRAVIQGVIDRVDRISRETGDVQLVDITEDNIVKVKLVRACGSCPMSR
jgi:Fe-S cluster biogenesis protein NfuA